MKKKKHNFQVCIVDRARHKKNWWRPGLTKKQKRRRRWKALWADYAWFVYFHTLRDNWSFPVTDVTIFFSFNVSKTIIRCGISNIQNNKGRVRGYQPRVEVELGVISRSRSLRLITLTETLIILDITKTSSHNCLQNIGSQWVKWNYISASQDYFSLQRHCGITSESRMICIFSHVER